MITFQTEGWEWDLSNLGLTFTENSDFFTDKITKSYSFPVNVKLTPDVAVKLGLINHNNIVSAKNKIHGTLLKYRKFYDAYIAINDVFGTNVEITIYYGSETLPVFDKKLSLLPFPVTVTPSGLPDFAKAQLSKEWPEVTHNFPKIFREDIKTKSNYNGFELFMNNYVENGGVRAFTENSIDLIEGENVPVNRNVMVPCPYLLEILTTIFQQEGREVRGGFISHPLVRKILLVPKTFFERYSVTQFLDYSFDTPLRTEDDNGVSLNVYERTHVPTAEGTYSLKMKINLSNAQASYFKLTVTQNNEVLYEASSFNKQVAINETLDINIVNTAIYDDIVVQLKLAQQEGSISAYNSFTYEHKEGLLNVFPDTYTISEFMPDMIVRDFINKVKTWFNLNFEYTKNAVYISFLENDLSTLVFQNKQHLEAPEPKRSLSTNNLFKLSYPNKQEAYFSKDGQVYSTTEFTDAETTKIDLAILPLKVSENYGSVTAVYPKNEEDLMFCLYNGTVADDNLAVDKINNISLTLDDVTKNFWLKWLKFRANSQTYKDSFTMHFSEVLDIKQGLFKYNKNHLIKTIRTKTIDEEKLEVEVTTETL